MILPNNILIPILIILIVFAFAILLLLTGLMMYENSQLKEILTRQKRVTDTYLRNEREAASERDKAQDRAMRMEAAYEECRAKLDNAHQRDLETSRLLPLGQDA